MLAGAPAQAQNSGVSHPGVVINAAGSDTTELLMDNVIGNGVVVSDAVTNGTTTVTSPGNGFGSVVDGSEVVGTNIVAGTTVTAHTSGSITLSAAATGSGTGITLNIGNEYNTKAQQSPDLVVPGDAHCSTVVYNTTSTSNPTFTDFTTDTGTNASGTTTVTSATANFTGADVGLAITVGNVSPANGVVIQSVTNSTTAVITGTASATSSAQAATVFRGRVGGSVIKGSSAGRRALRDSVAGTFPTAQQGTGQGCVDIGRSSADSNVPGGTDGATKEYNAFALDIVNWATPSLNAPATMTLQNLKDIYNCVITNWAQLPGGSYGQIQRVLAQSNSGTEASFLNRVLGFNAETVAARAQDTATYGALDLGCPALKQVEENHGNYLTILAQGGDPALYQQMIYPYSAGKWVYQATNSSNPTLDIRNGVRVGAITTTPGDATSAAYPVRWGGSTFFLNNNGQAHFSVTDAVTNGTATISSATAGFKASDEHLAVSGTNIPANSFVHFVDSTHISLSSSSTANVPVNATGSGTGGTLTLTGTVASESNPNVSDLTNTHIFAGVRYLYNVIDTNEPNLATVRSLVSFDDLGTAKSPLCSGGKSSAILSAGFLPLTAQTSPGGNTGVTCRIVP